MADKRKQLNILFEAVTEHLVRLARDQVPETGSFRRVSMGGYRKGHPFHSILGIEESYESETMRRISLGMYREGEDRVISNYLFRGTKQEVIAWLEDPENRQEIIDTFEHLESRLEEE